MEKKKDDRIRDWIVLILIVIAAAFIVPNFILFRVNVYQESMQNTLKEGDSLLVEKVSLYFTNPKRFDIIILRTKEEENYIKRVIGLPGETIQIKDGKTYINGKELTDSYGHGNMKAGTAAEPVTLKADELFVMGDNRAVSIDSRDEGIGPVKKKQIKGRAVFRVWPLKKFGAVD